MKENINSMADEASLFHVESKKVFIVIVLVLSLIGSASAEVIDTLSDGSAEKNLTFPSGGGGQTVYLKIPSDANVTSAFVNISGYRNLSVIKKGETLPCGRQWTSAAFASNTNKTYIFGGYEGCGGWHHTDEIVEYDALTGNVTQKGTLPSGRDATSAAYANGKIYVFGGWDGSSSLDDVVEYDPLSGNATKKAETFPVIVSATSAAYFPPNNRIYIFGFGNDFSFFF